MPLSLCLQYIVQSDESLFSQASLSSCKLGAIYSPVASELYKYSQTRKAMNKSRPSTLSESAFLLMPFIFQAGNYTLSSAIRFQEKVPVKVAKTHFLLRSHFLGLSPGLVVFSVDWR